MRLVNLHGRAALVVSFEGSSGTAIDIASASDQRFGPDIDDLYRRWDEFRAWVSTSPADPASGMTFTPADLAAPVVLPRQILALGLNYRDHASEAGFDVPEGLPPVFTKFVTSITGPDATVALPDGNVDWEVELAVVIGRTARHVQPEHAWGHIAGVTVAQDLSERVLQMSGPAPQFSLGKSYPGFLPIGPALVTTDELEDPTALDLSAAINDETVQQGNTRDLIVPVAESIARLSDVLTLLPGDIILTGTPAGVGMGRKPERYLHPGDVLVSTITGIGTITQRFVGSPS